VTGVTQYLFSNIFLPKKVYLVSIPKMQFKYWGKLSWNNCLLLFQNVPTTFQVEINNLPWLPIISSYTKCFRQKSGRPKFELGAGDSKNYCLSNFSPVMRNDLRLHRPRRLQIAIMFGTEYFFFLFDERQEHNIDTIQGDEGPEITKEEIL